MPIIPACFSFWVFVQTAFFPYAIVSLSAGMDTHGRPLRYSKRRPPAQPCPVCQGRGIARAWQGACSRRDECPGCDGIGYHGIDPRVPTCVYPGTLEKVAVLRARFLAGVRLYRPGDAKSYDGYEIGSSRRWQGKGL